jgi:transposase-like protein
MTEMKQSTGWSWEERREIVREFRASGQTQRAFCRQWGITANTLRSWCRRFDDEGGGGEESGLAGLQTPRWLAVEIQAEAPTSETAAIGLVTRAGVRIEVREGFDAQTLQRLLVLLGEAA